MAQKLPYVVEVNPDAEWCASVVVEVALAVGTPEAPEVWRVRLDANGYPPLLDGEEAARVNYRLAAMSVPMGGKLSFADGRGTWYDSWTTRMARAG